MSKCYLLPVVGSSKFLQLSGAPQWLLNFAATSCDRLHLHHFDPIPTTPTLSQRLHPTHLSTSRLLLRATSKQLKGPNPLALCQLKAPKPPLLRLKHPKNRILPHCCREVPGCVRLGGGFFLTGLPAGREAITAWKACRQTVFVESTDSQEPRKV